MQPFIFIFFKTTRFTYSPLIWALNRSACLVSALALGPAAIRLFSSSSILMSGLSRHNTHPSAPVNIEKLANPNNRPWWTPGTPLPEAELFFMRLPSIHAPDFISVLYNALQFLNDPASGATQVKLLIECLLEGNRYRSLRSSVTIGPNYTMENLENLFREAIENFEAQSGTGEEGPSVIATRARVVNVSSAPNPEAIPFTSDQANVQWKKDIKADRKALRRPTATMQAIDIGFSQLDTKLDSMSSNLSSGLSQVVQAIKESSTPQPVVNASSPLGVNWTPIIQGLVSGVATSFGAKVEFPMTSSPVQPTSDLSPTVTQSLVDLTPILSQIESLNTKITVIQSEMQSVRSEIKEIAINTNHQINTLAQNTNNQISQLASLIETLAKNSNNNNGGGTSSVPSTPAVPETAPSSNGRMSLAQACAFISQQALTIEEEQETQNLVGITVPSPMSTEEMVAKAGFNPFIPPAEENLSDSEEEDAILQDPNKTLIEGPPKEQVNVIPSSKEAKGSINFEDRIVTADLESIITPQGHNEVYMAAWYNGKNSNIFYLDSKSLNKEEFMRAFWADLIKNNEGRICYFHNWGGYDSILSLPTLLNFKPGLTFNPIMKDGELLCLEVKEKTITLLTVKDSIKVLPASLSKLAKDWKVETLKDHFPHYFYLNNIKETMLYEGAIPSYACFEPKRTSLKDYNEMIELFKNSPWNFIEVSKTYILSDCKALYQILIAFFESVLEKFPIDPTVSLSAPSTAFKIWRTVQKPSIGEHIADFSNSKWDAYLRQSYNGGIVDVYKFHLTRKGYYYDVNSLYPTAMCNPMPVGLPTPVDSQLWGHNFFGFIDCTVRAPLNEYLGLLSIKWQGRLVCPGGTFRGLFFSEELKFALENGYTIIQIHQLIQFTRGNAFKELILTLNEMKIQAQKEGKPTIRNLAKLLMNSMYGRFGMHTTREQSALLNNQEYEQYSRVFQILSEIHFKEYNLIQYSYNNEETRGDTKLDYILTKYFDSLNMRTNVALASAVTAYSRMLINAYKLQALKIGLSLYYSDTDSLVLNGPLPENLNLVDSATLGKLKLENKFKEGIFIMPKVYFLELEIGRVDKMWGLE